MPDFLSPPSRLVIASRASRLALWQAELIRAQLQNLYPECEIVIDAMTTRGDQVLDRALSKIGGKGLFIKELESALLDGRCDLAVHSLKDVPMILAPEFTLAAIPPRASAYDALVSNEYGHLADLPPGAIIGTSSLRRKAQLGARYPQLIVQPLRGNLDTRLAKLDRGEFAGIILATAGLERLGLAARIRTVLDGHECLPAPGQGALAIEICAPRDDLRAWLAPLHDAASAACVDAERALARQLGGSCEVPLAAHATIVDRQLSLHALVARPDGSMILRDHCSGSSDDAEALGVALAQGLIEQGALEILN